MGRGAAERAMRRLDAAPTRLPDHARGRKLGWLCVTVVAVVVLAVAPAVSIVYAFFTEGLDWWPILLVSAVPTAMLAYWVIGGAYLRSRMDRPRPADRIGPG